MRVTALRATALRAGRWIRWYLRQSTGEAKWDEYLERTAHEGLVPISRRDFEHHRSEHSEKSPPARCC